MPQRVKAEQPSTIWVESIVADRNMEPYVVVRWGEERGQLTPGEARDHAAGVLQAAAAAESDAFLMEVVMRHGEIAKEKAAAVLVEFRKQREKPPLMQGLLNLPDRPAQMTPKETRSYGGELLVMAELADAQAFLAGFLTEQVGLPAGVVAAIAQEYADAFLARHKGNCGKTY